ncbi:chaperone protein DnaJ 1 [Abditibacteriota bacterium]|nr:chaperone protein DnaJ 1 [Abditibacteriota bacterium]
MSTPLKDDLYATLRVQSSADLTQIKTAYRALVREFHPDANPHRRQEAEARMKGITEAYAILGDPQKRAQYDLDRRLILAEIQMPINPGALLTRVRVALQLSAEECAERLGMGTATFADLEQRDALPTSPVQSRTFVGLLDAAAISLEKRGELMAARDLRLDLERKRARKAILR